MRFFFAVIYLIFLVQTEQLCFTHLPKKKFALNKSHLTFKSRSVTTEGGAGAAVWWRLALGREFTPANSKTAEDRGAERDTSDPLLKEGHKNTLQVLF